VILGVQIPQQPRYLDSGLHVAIGRSFAEAGGDELFHGNVEDVAIARSVVMVGTTVPRSRFEMACLATSAALAKSP